MSFVPFENPIGFGASDVVEIAWAAVMVALAILWRPLIAPAVSKLAGRMAWSMALLAALPVALRLLLLPHHPAPSPDVFDEFGHLFVADTLRHFRLANPAHPLSQFFETIFVLQSPTYSSIYPLGQGIALAAGRMIFGHPWAGVLMSTAAFCALCYWMLRAWTLPSWALAGGLLAVFEFGPLSQWMNGYWGGTFAAMGGCLVFGSLPRLLDRARKRDALLLGIGLGLNILTRPYESLFLAASVALFFIPVLRDAKRFVTSALIVTVAAVAALGLTALHNKRVTGKWTELPYQLSQFQYGVPASLTFLPDPVPHHELTPQQALEYKSQLAFRGTDRETLQSFLLRLEYRVRYYRFFFLPPLFLALPFFLARLREWRFAWVALTLVLFALGINFFPAFQTHYLGPVACLFVLAAVAGLERMSRWNPDAARIVMFLCVAHFLFWYTLHIYDRREFSLALRPYETWDGLNHQNPERRIVVNRRLQSMPGKLLVFVRYSPQHMFQDEWVYNEADLDAARVVWARDLGPEENQKLRAYYPDRTVLLFEPDGRPMRLEPYQESVNTPSATDSLRP
jgi:hypothetical protein